MSWYYNAAGQRCELPERPLEPPERPLEPPDCWARRYDEYGDSDPEEEELEQNDES